MCSAISSVLPAAIRGVRFCAQTTPARTKIIGATAHLRRFFICLFCDCVSLLKNPTSIHRDKAANNHPEQTVKNHTHRVLRQVNAGDRYEAVETVRSCGRVSEHSLSFINCRSPVKALAFSSCPRLVVTV